MRYYKDTDYVVDLKGQPLTKIEKDFLNLIKKIQEKYGSGVVLAYLTILEAVAYKA